MNRLFKTAMLWLLALALPVQGFAAVTQSSCAPQMQHVFAESEVIQSSVQSHHQSGAAEHQHHQMQADHTVGVDTTAATDHQTNSHAKVKCSACATCCIGVAMVPVMPQLPAFPTVSSPIVSSFSSMLTGHIPDGLKRPPKFCLV